MMVPVPFAPTVPVLSMMVPVSPITVPLAPAFPVFFIYDGPGPVLPRGPGPVCDGPGLPYPGPTCPLVPGFSYL